MNLGNATGHPSRIMDGSFANQVLAQIFLFGQKYADLSAAQKAERLTVEVLPKKLDEEVALEMVRGFGGVVTPTDQDPGRLHRRGRRRSVQATRLSLLSSYKREASSGKREPQARTCRARLSTCP